MKNLLAIFLISALLATVNNFVSTALMSAGSPDADEPAQTAEAFPESPSTCVIPVSGTPDAYILHITDQDGLPVPGVRVKFCTDLTCMMEKSDKTGTVTFSGSPDVYHVELYRVPEGYSFDPDFELVTGKTYGEWVLRIRKD